MSALPSLAAPRSAAKTELLEPIRDFSHGVVQLLKPEIVATGLAPSAFWPLHHLDRGPERHPGELARRLGITPAACSASVDQLVAGGYVARRPSERDRRQILLVVTPKGHRTLEAIWKKFDASLRDLLTGIPEEDVAVTARTLRTLAQRLQAERPAPAEGDRA
ncbi:MAG TPA: MarR family winged helix-turn-helix transcriptional regulator [Thermoplasmata archaeon]|nr:MarR family winged helix-turn-helix transcriptional regulator [Thermoplasmata archaeon]